MVRKFVAYVDEAGDEGFGKLAGEGPTGQSRWFVLGACIVEDRFDAEIVAWKRAILDLFPYRKAPDIHFRDFNHEQKVQIALSLAPRPMGICTIASNKVTLLSHPKREIFKQRQHLYNYLTRFLLERLTAACAQKAKVEHQDAAELRVVFSRRRGTDYQQMREYLEFMRDGHEKFAPVRSIDWAVLDPANIAVENHAKRAGLQLADVVTTSIYSALEPNIYGSCEDRYARHLISRMLMRNARVLNCGLTLIPPTGRCPLNDEQREYVEWAAAYRRP